VRLLRVPLSAAVSVDLRVLLHRRLHGGQQDLRRLRAAALTGFGYLLLKLDCEPAPLILGFVLGPLMEENLRRAMMIAQATPAVFVRPISAAFLLAASC